jgi:hypothetical protein
VADRIESFAVSFSLPAHLPLRRQREKSSGGLSPGLADIALRHLRAGSDAPTVSYATVYPLTTLLRILSAQVLAIFFFR